MKTNPSYSVDTTFTGKDISSVSSVYEFTVLLDGKYKFLVKLTNGAGNGDYEVYLSHQWLGTGDFADTPIATFTIPSGTTVFEFPSIEVDLKTDDVLRVMILGQAGDTSVNGAIRISYDNPSLLEQSDILSDATPFSGADIGASVSITSSDKTDIAQRTWNSSYASSRTLTQGASSVVDSVSGTDLSCYNNSDIDITITDLSDLSGYQEIWFTVKSRKESGDDESILQLHLSNPTDSENDGLIYINRVVATDKTKGSITYLSSTSIQIQLSASESQKLSARDGLYYDVKAKISNKVVPISEDGTFNIYSTVTTDI